MKDKNCKELTVAHSVKRWLPLTQTWIFNQLKCMDAVHSIVLVNTTLNLDLFPWAPIYRSDKINYWISKLTRKLGLGYRRYSSVYDVGIREHRPKIVHSHFGDKGWYDLPLVQKYGLKQVVTFYGFDLSMLPEKHPVWRRRYHELFDQADLFLCEGPHMAQTLIMLGCPEEKVKVHRLGVDLDKIPYVPRSLSKDDRLKVLIAGAFREKKGIPYALEALGQLQDQIDLEITLIGDAVSGKSSRLEKQKILSVLERYGLQPKTRMLGFQPHPILLKEAYEHHLFLSPSVTSGDGDTEGGAPVVIIEMVATGMPVVSTTHCDIPQVVRYEGVNLLVEERDVEGLVQHVRWLVEHPERWETITSSGRQHVEAEFDARSQAKKLEEIYFQICEEC
jgi:colanic acid/amylovoran biosynthesis glycosyltransferase